MSFNGDLSDVFLMIRMALGILERNTTEIYRIVSTHVYVYVVCLHTQYWHYTVYLYYNLFKKLMASKPSLNLYSSTQLKEFLYEISRHIRSYKEYSANTHYSQTDLSNLNILPHLLQFSFFFNFLLRKLIFQIKLRLLYAS